MAVDLSFVDNYLPPLPPIRPQRPQEEAVPVSTYDKLTPTQKAWVDKQLELQRRPRSALGEIGAGIMRGAVSELPRMVGQGLKATGKPGDVLYDLGANVVEGAAAREPAYAEDVNPDAHNAVTQAFAQGGAMLAPSLAPLAALPALAFAGVPAAAGLTVAGAAGAGLFGAAQYQDTYEKAVKEGKTPQEAHELGLQTGAIEAGGEAVGTYIGGKFLTGIPRLLGRPRTVSSALKGLREPEFLKTFARELTKTAAVETGTEMGQNYGEAAVEQAAGIDKTQPWDAATSAIGPTLAMTALMGPFGAVNVRRHQNRNAALVRAVEDPNSTPEQVDAAASALSPQLEPLVGKEQVREWRLNALETANKNKEQREQAAKDAELAEQTQQGEQMAAANAAAQQRREDAALLANRPAGAMPFDEFVEVQKKQLSLDFAAGRKKKKGESRLTADGLRNDYLVYLRGLAEREAAEQEDARRNTRAQQEELTAAGQGLLFPTNLPGDPAQYPNTWIPAAQEQPFTLEPSGTERALPVDTGEPLPFTPRNDAQGELDLVPVMNRPAGERPSPLKQPPAAAPTAPPKTAMQLALERAGAKRAVETDAAYAQREREKLVELKNSEQAKVGQVAALAKVAEQTRRVEAANRLADAALAGKINGNTPIAHADLMHTWEQASAEQGIDTSVLRGAARKKVELAVKSASGKKLYMQQLNALRAARDAMKGGTVGRDTMSALVAKLENWNGQNANADAQGQGNAETEGQKALLTKEQINAAQAGVVTESGVVQHQGDDRSRAPAQASDSGGAQPRKQVEGVARAAPAQVEVTPVNAAPGSEAVKSPPPVPVDGFGAAPQQVEEVGVTTTGQEVPWGDYSRTVPAGDISYETPNFRPLPRQEIKRGKAARLGPIVRESDQRPVDRALKFYFELHHYDPREPRGAAGNRTWVMDYMRAKDISEGKRTGAHITPMLESERLDLPAKEKQANALAALGWLEYYSPEDYQLAPKRAAQLERIFDVNAAAHDFVEGEKRKLRMHYTDAYRAMVAKRKGIQPKNVVIDDAAKAEIERLVQDDPGFEYAHAAAPNYMVTEELMRATETGSVKNVLFELALNAPSDWIRTLAVTLGGLKLDTKIRVINKIAYDPNGERVYARYDHGQNIINVYLGGANAHTLTHEIVHAATVGRIRMGMAASKQPVAQRTAEEHAAVESLTDLRAFMAAMKKLDPNNQYAFRSEEEFVAEAQSNRKFQQWLHAQQYDARTGLQKFFDWVVSLLGGNKVEGINALDYVLNLNKGFLSNSRFADAEGLTYNHSATGAMAQTDRAVSALVQTWQRAAANSEVLGRSGERARAGLLMASSTFNIAQWVERVPALKPLVDGIDRMMESDRVRRVLRQQKALEFSTVTDAIKLALAKHPRAKEMNQKLMWFAGNMSALGIDLNKNFDENKRANPKLDPTNRAFVNQLHAEYKQLPDVFKRPLEMSFRLFRKNYIQQTAVLLRERLRAYAKTSPQLEGLITLLDIQNAGLFGGVNPRPEYYHDAYSANLDKTIRKVIAEVRQMSTGKDHLDAEVRDIDKFYNLAVANPYMHLGRSGDYYTQFTVLDTPGAWERARVVMDKYGKAMGARTNEGRVFLRFENPYQRDDMLRELNGLGVVKPGSTTQGSLFDPDAIYNLQGVPAFARHMVRQAQEQFRGKERAEIREFITRLVLDYLPESSPHKALAQRQDGSVAGYDLDFMRNFSKRSSGMASMLSNSYTMPLYDDAFAEMKHQVKLMEQGANAHHSDMANQVMREMSRRFTNSISAVESPYIDAFKAFGFNYFLAFSPAFWLTNLMQPWHLTLPYIGGRYGFVATAKEMGKSTAKAGKLMSAALASGWNTGKDVGGLRGALVGILDLKLPVDQVGLTQEEQWFVQQLMESGQLDTTQGHELARFASGDSPNAAMATKMLSMGSHYTEVLNRLTAGLAAYTLARRAGKSQEAAKLYAIKAVVETQYDYSDHNTARALGRHGVLGKVTPLVASFQQYAFQTMELLIRLMSDSVTGPAEERAVARKTLAGVMATTSMMAGTLGLPMANAVAAVLNRLLGSGDDPADVQSAYRAWLADVFGKDVAEAIARGVPRSVLGFDTSTRMGMQDVLPGTRFMADRRDLKTKLEAGAFNLLGPAVSASTSALVGLGKAMDGQVMDGLIDMLPLALKGPVKAVKQEDVGFTTSTGNKLPIEVTPWGTVAQTLGFTPSAKAEQSEVNFAFRQRDTLLKTRKNKLANAAYRAIENGEDATAAIQDVMLFNEQNPAYSIDISAGLRLRAKQRATAEITDIPTLPRYLPTLDRYSYANVK